EGESFPIQVVRPGRFALPRDRTRPIVMFAGGVGISPFLGFIAERSRDGSTGKNLLFFATRSSHHVYCEDELTEAAVRGNLALQVIFSAEDGGLRGGYGEPVVRTNRPRARIAEAIASDPDIQATLWDLLRSPRDGGQGAYFYVCGRAGFAHSVMAALTAVA